jgi:uncharacterized membrane protein YhaH (DUF805 family)
MANTAAAPPREEDAAFGATPMNWGWVFLSFRGRLSRKQFSRASSALFVSYAIVWILSSVTGERDMFHYGACLAFCLATIWPVLAVCSKRLHDSERTVLLAVPVALLWPLVPGWWLAVDSGAIEIPIPYAMGIWLTILAALALSGSKIETFSGTVGPNRFGPQPSDAEGVNADPVMLPFQDKDGTGWHVTIRYHRAHERRIDGFATENEALDWIIANAQEIVKPRP